MKYHIKITLLFSSFILLVSGNADGAYTSQPKTPEKPNIIYIMVDDLGYGDVGAFFQNQRRKDKNNTEPRISTPHLDDMIAGGAMLTNHYAAAPVCAPSRASLLSGLSQGHATVRDNQFDKALADNYTLGNVLQMAGYTTSAIGKWGLQGRKLPDEGSEKWPAHPLYRGFNYYYGYIRHKDGHEHYPVEGKYDGPKEVYENHEEVSTGLGKCYTGDLFTAIAKKWITRQSTEKNNKPFFMYLAYDTPHAVLELPTQAYPAGGGLKGGLQWVGKPGNMINTASGTIDSWIHPDYVNATYDHDRNPATPELAWPNVYKRYATSVRRIDDQVGDLLHLLKDLKIQQNTLIVFSSDNGPSIESYLKEEYKANFFNSFGPFSGIKRDLLEGGMRTPTIVWWPGHIKAGQVITHPSISYDWLPTFTQAAGLPAPVNSNGVSLLPVLTGKGRQDTSLIYSEYFVKGKTPDYPEFSANYRAKQRNQMQMLRAGDFVGLRYDIKNGNDDFEIYNVADDDKQSENLAGNNLRGLQQYFKERVLQIRMADTSAKRPYDESPLAAVSSTSKLKKGLIWKSFQADCPWIPNTSGLYPVKQGIINKPEPGKLKHSKGTLHVFEGFINVPASGKYTFYLKSSGKAFFKLHHANVIDADYAYELGTERKGSLHLQKGAHPVKIYYINADVGNNLLEMKWEGPAIVKSEIAPQFYSRSL